MYPMTESKVICIYNSPDRFFELLHITFDSVIGISYGLFYFVVEMFQLMFAIGTFLKFSQTKKL